MEISFGGEVKEQKRSGHFDAWGTLEMGKHLIQQRKQQQGKEERAGGWGQELRGKH